MPKGLTINEKKELKKVTVMCKRRAASTGNPYSVKKMNGKLRCVPGPKRKPVNTDRATQPQTEKENIKREMQ